MYTVFNMWLYWVCIMLTVRVCLEWHISQINQSINHQSFSNCSVSLTLHFGCWGRNLAYRLKRKKNILCFDLVFKSSQFERVTLDSEYFSVLFNLLDNTIHSMHLAGMPNRARINKNEYMSNQSGITNQPVSQKQWASINVCGIKKRPKFLFPKESKCVKCLVMKSETFTYCHSISIMSFMKPWCNISQN